MSRATDLLHQVHEARRELEALGADAGVRVTVTVEPITLVAAAAIAPAPGTWRSDKTPAAARHNDGLVFAVIKADGGWVGSAAVADALAVPVTRLGQPIGRLLTAGCIEHNGKPRRGSAYRAVAGRALGEREQKLRAAVVNTLRDGALTPRRIAKAITRPHLDVALLCRKMEAEGLLHALTGGEYALDASLEVEAA